MWLVKEICTIDLLLSTLHVPKANQADLYDAAALCCRCLADEADQHAYAQLTPPPLSALRDYSIKLQAQLQEVRICLVLHQMALHPLCFICILLHCSTMQQTALLTQGTFASLSAGPKAAMPDAHKTDGPCEQLHVQWHM